ncbi:SGNH/GDSL hydrolase family protein [Cyclobacterium marinum]|uniref:Lipolytic protein G-D-S-L family n=1 Tax=Cyclobacterium marinum (strain ATCC 25205 / DSM 745 / LMG 13164 / NCIMB 1802) TaxID=880070 RepID=G0J7E0_CYCMS|nr:SGNH/GDSL hydrolase family protein [Cyclobacterium marinum]AEL28594.1 lipolytic protein G-D-S-L family [Cyclobacterium marinum DSM 745]
MKNYNFAFLAVLLFISTTVFAQDPTRFKGQVEKIHQDNPIQENLNSIVFTGSSTIRMWKSLQEDFPQHNVINAGFGGSQASDLLYYIDELILDYKPTKVFIYEGDNDISSGKSTDEILMTFNLITSKIHEALPETEIVIISPKPSVARWKLADQYLELNKKLKKFTKSEKYMKYADLWKPMLNKDKEPMDDIFIQDNLHMNEKGYAIWAKTIKKYL